MKSIIKLFLISFVFIFSSCTNSEETGSVVFYTNIQFLTNCGEYDVEIYLEGDHKGILERPVIPLDSVPNCNSFDPLSLLILELPNGDYTYEAKAVCHENLNETGEFSIEEDDCTVVCLLELKIE